MIVVEMKVCAAFLKWEDKLELLDGRRVRSDVDAGGIMDARGRKKS